MNDLQLRDAVSQLLRQSRSHAGLGRALQGFPPELAGRTVEGFQHTVWEQVEHLRLAAEDLVDYCRRPDYEELGWPEGYWPSSASPPDSASWHRSVERLQAATEAMAELVEDRGRDLFEPVPTAVESHHHTLRAALILLDHNGYHAGQVIAQRIALGVWPPDAETGHDNSL